jgi:hypothetical protein
MSWRAPPKLPVATDVLGIEHVNEALLPVAEELSGELNEHNWANGAFTSRLDDLHEDACMQVPGTIFARNMDAAKQVDAKGSVPTGYAIIEDTMGWSTPTTAAGDAWSTSFLCRDGLLWVHISFQAQTVWPGVLFGIAVDGNLIPESVCGSVAHLTEEVRAPSNSLGGSSPGLVRLNTPVVLECLVPVPAGLHVIELRAMAVNPRDAARNAWSPKGIFVAGGTIIPILLTATR